MWTPRRGSSSSSSSSSSSGSGGRSSNSRANGFQNVFEQIGQQAQRLFNSSSSGGGDGGSRSSPFRTSPNRNFSVFNTSSYSTSSSSASQSSDNNSGPTGSRTGASGGGGGGRGGGGGGGGSSSIGGGGRGASSNEDSDTERARRWQEQWDAASAAVQAQQRQWQQHLAAMGGGGGATGGGEATPERPPGPPPAAATALSTLPNVKVTAADIADEANCTCCICIDEFELGEDATRLPCGHLFHRQCVEDWLSRHCTCPTCRYELKSDDRDFESGRRYRMQSQRPRYRLPALKSKTVHELRRLASAVGIDVRDCLEKSDLVQRIATSGRIEIIPSASSTAVSSSASTDGDSSSGTRSANSWNGVAASSTPSSSSSSSGSPCFRRSTLNSMSVGELKRLLRSFGVADAEVGACIEKRDLINTILRTGRIRILPEMAASRINHSTADAMDTTPNQQQNGADIEQAKKFAADNEKGPIATSASGFVENTTAALDVDVDSVDNHVTNGRLFNSSYSYGSSSSSSSSNPLLYSSGGAVAVTGASESSSASPISPSVLGEEGGSGRNGFDSHSSTFGGGSGSSSGSSPTSSNYPRTSVTRNALDTMTIGNLRALMSSLGVPLQGCLEKEDMVERLVSSGALTIV